MVDHDLGGALETNSAFEFLCVRPHFFLGMAICFRTFSSSTFGSGHFAFDSDFRP